MKFREHEITIFTAGTNEINKEKMKEKTYSLTKNVKLH